MPTPSQPNTEAFLLLWFGWSGWVPVPRPAMLGPSMEGEHWEPGQQAQLAGRSSTLPEGPKVALSVVGGARWCH